VVDGIDGYDGCDERLRARLIEDVSALRNHGGLQ
jgi:hypothetical protein